MTIYEAQDKVIEAVASAMMYDASKEANEFRAKLFKAMKVNTHYWFLNGDAVAELSSVEEGTYQKMVHSTESTRRFNTIKSGMQCEKVWDKFITFVDLLQTK